MLRVVEPPEVTEDKLNEIKLHLKVDHDEEDVLISTLINATREYAEGTLCGRAFEVQTLELVVDGFSDVIVLPRPPLIGVESIKCYTQDGTEHTLQSIDYEVYSGEEPGVVMMKCKIFESIKETIVTYKAGYAVVPAEFLLWQKVMVAHYYENRQAILPSGHNIMKTPFVADYLLQSYRMFGFGVS